MKKITEMKGRIETLETQLLQKMETIRGYYKTVASMQNTIDELRDDNQSWQEKYKDILLENIMLLEKMRDVERRDNK